MKEVLVIGAGPAGAVAAARLAQRGYRVLVLEKQQFPRFSIGESLLAQSLGLIEQAGMLEAVLAAGFQFKNGAAFVRNGRHAEFNFAQKSTAGYGYTFQVPRADFDKVLADEAARLGAEIRYQVEITGVDFSGARAQVISRNRDGAEERHSPDFVLDASGFGRVLPRLLDLERPSGFPERAALFTHIEDHIEAGAFDRQKIRVSIHPDHTDVWYWLIPFSNGRSSLGVVASRAFLQQHAGSNEERLWHWVAQETSLQRLLVRARPVAKVGEIVGYAASVTRLWGPHFALLGNAAEFLDPVFSSGVTIALKSGALAADALDRQWRGEAVDWDAEFAQPLLLGVETFRGFVQGWYDGSLQDIIFFDKQDPKIRRYICAILAGYAWDKDNPYVGPQSGRRLQALAHACRNA